MDGKKHLIISAKSLKIDHFNIVVENMEKTLKFYKEILQFEIIAELELRDDTYQR